MYTISLLVGPEQGIRDRNLDNFNFAALGVGRAGQSVVGIL